MPGYFKNLLYQSPKIMKSTICLSKKVHRPQCQFFVPERPQGGRFTFDLKEKGTAIPKKGKGKASRGQKGKGKMSGTSFEAHSH